MPDNESLPNWVPKRAPRRTRPPAEATAKPQLEPIDPRIFGRRLAETRKARGLTQEEVADYLRCSRPTYIAIEKGDRLAKPDEIVTLAAYLGRTVHELVRPTEPIADLQPHLRAVVDRLKSGDERALHAAIAELHQFAEDYRELEQFMSAPLRHNYPPELSLNPRIDPIQLGEDTADEERRRLGLGNQPVIYLRSLLEWVVGLRIFYSDKLPAAVAGMYAYTADLGCCILVNRNHPAERRRLSMLHEYGHLIADRFKPGIDYLTMKGRKPANERFAEAFALGFLMPANSLRQRFHDIVTTTGDFQVADLRRLSHFYFASVQAMTLRLEQLALISRGSWDFLKESRFAPAQAAELLGLPPQPADNHAFPQRYKFLAVHAFEQEKISQGQLARFLRCDPVTARAIVQDCRTSQHVDDETGERHTAQLDFGHSLLSGVP